jgi:uncharacterized protein YdiU (UPF0061 family)
MIKLNQLERSLASLLANYEEWEKEVVYAELLEYARLVTKKYEKAFAGVRSIEQVEREKQALVGGKQSLPVTAAVGSTKIILKGEP